MKIVDVEIVHKSLPGCVGRPVKSNHCVAEIKPNYRALRMEKFDASADIKSKICSTRGNAAFQRRRINKNRYAGNAAGSFGKMDESGTDFAEKAEIPYAPACFDSKPRFTSVTTEGDRTSKIPGEKAGFGFHTDICQRIIGNATAESDVCHRKSTLLYGSEMDADFKFAGIHLPCGRRNSRKHKIGRR